MHPSSAWRRTKGGKAGCLRLLRQGSQGKGCMPETRTIVSPFRGIRYRLGEAHDLSEVIAPPFDIISEEMRAALEARHPHNFVRIELPQGGEERYARAAETLRQWLASSVLARDQEPALYLLEQVFQVGGRRLRRRGVFGLVRLPEPGEAYVLAHEGTLSEPKADRLRLLRACRAMTSAVFMIAEDRRGELAGRLQAVKGELEAVAEESREVTHHLWVIREQGAMADICGAVGAGPLVIADGHHRFETALSYRQEMRRANTGEPEGAGFDYGLCVVVSARDEGFEILPTHRLVSCRQAGGKERAKALMREHFEVHEWPLPDPGRLGRQPWLEGAAPDRHVFGAYCGDGKYYVLIARDEMLQAPRRVVDGLDVSILHRYLIDRLLPEAGPAGDADGRISHDSDTTGAPSPGARLRYVTDEEQAIAAVDRGDYDVALFLRPTKVADVVAAALAGERMPGKSTYFYPKVPAGMVIADASANPI